jgi:putative acetyltransferase
MAAPIDPVLITPASGDADYELIREMFLEYAESLGFSLAYQGFDRELEELPGSYGPPGGALLLARVGERAAGTVALRRLAPGIGEMKRLYVRPAYRGIRTGHGNSIGRALADGIVGEARRLGYGRIRLDTVADKMKAAMRLYGAMGFVEVAPYYESPVPGTVFMELVL